MCSSKHLEFSSAFRQHVYLLNNNSNLNTVKKGRQIEQCQKDHSCPGTFTERVKRSALISLSVEQTVRGIGHWDRYNSLTPGDWLTVCHPGHYKHWLVWKLRLKVRTEGTSGFARCSAHPGQNSHPRPGSTLPRVEMCRWGLLNPFEEASLPTHSLFTLVEVLKISSPPSRCSCRYKSVW